MMINEKELNEFEEQLRKEAEKTETHLQKFEQNVDFGNDVDHFDEEADEAEEFANRLGLRKVLQERLKRIYEALDRIKKGIYGVCEKCNGEISSKLLNIDPATNYCQKCKQLVL
ncbi:MAG: hypothetical protein QMD65_00280 [Patescibacteria group bacterium]|nr:hypothetical protein [Patescibacteria group bacterium]